ncbi:porin [Cupriavidus sp. D39]|uniref:porin n=1 Tax=Cupriavidus sp. D39 TaxID=2997877 RepID=UPI00226E8E23|nr:porin [Cupriavidus sp. D39]MCY0854779.1 porin [Cupriavidus sp. D39]
MKMIRAARVRLLLVPILAVWAMNSNAEFDLHLFGLVDAGVDVGRSGKGTTARQISGGDAGSRWGMDGTEDLGQGLSATFRLVGGFGADDGTLGQGGACSDAKRRSVWPKKRWAPFF